LAVIYCTVCGQDKTWVEIEQKPPAGHFAHSTYGKGNLIIYQGKCPDCGHRTPYPHAPGKYEDRIGKTMVCDGCGEKYPF